MTFRCEKGRKQKKKRRFNINGDNHGSETDTDSDKEIKTKGKKKKAKFASTRIEGMPLLIYGEWLLWMLLLLFLLAIFIFQFLALERKVAGFDRKGFEKLWILVSITYLSASVAHSIATTRNGYKLSASSCLSFGFFRRLSIRGRPVNEVSPISILKTTWPGFLCNVLFWVVTLSLKGLFDYFLIIKPLADSLNALSHESWLSSVFPNEKTYLLHTDVHLPVNGDFLLMIARAVPSFLVTFVDTSAFYLIMTAVCRTVTEMRPFSTRVRNFSRLGRLMTMGPRLWWHKGVACDCKSNISCALYQQTSLPHDELAHSAERENGKSKEDRNLKPHFFCENAERYAFAVTWNEIIDDLRETDMISNAEQVMLQYTQLPGHKSMIENAVSPWITPTFVFADELQNMVERRKLTDAQISLVEELRDWVLYLLLQLGIIDKDLASSLKSVFLSNAPVHPAHCTNR